MARTDMEVALEVLTQRLANARIAGPVLTKTSGALWGVESLPVAFDEITSPLTAIGR